ncbi:MAG: hypothetical protein IH840_04305 [Candidatus Heimdallarchaeota archaeon]|nr:hypothetical protein [Candidatus Heimdallarchaeota archaeon]
MDLKEIQTKQKEFILARKWSRFSATQIFSHLIEELGEIVSYFLYEEKYKVKGAGHNGTENNLKQEFAQAFNLFLQLAIHANVDLEQAWLEETKLMAERFDIDLWQKLAEDENEI